MANQATKVGRIEARLSRNLLGLRRDLVSLCHEVKRLSASQRRLEAQATRLSSGGPAQRVVRRRALTPADRARLKVQGRYLGLVRHLSATAQRRVKALKALKGYAPALRLARQISQGR